MLTLKLPEVELWDAENEQFIVVDGGTFHFEHSLRAISKWEDAYEKPFLVNQHTDSEMLDYFVCMCLEDIDKSLITSDVAAQIGDYMSAKHSATRITSRDDPSGGTIQTSETLYASMAMAGVPFECDSWNINRLLTVLKVIAERNNPPKKMSRGEILAQNRALNAQRKAALHTKG